MGLRQRQWAERTRDAIFDILGRVCVDCGATEQLEFDCIIPQGNKHHREMEWSWRMSFYRQQLANGNLAVRCQVCNGRKQAKEEYQLELAAIERQDPF